VLHPERGVTRAHGVILVGKRGSEERHDPVAHHLVDRALVAMDGLHHDLEDRIEDLARFLGIAVGEQLHGALQVGEEAGDLLALTIEGGPRGENALSQVFRGVDARGGETGRRWTRHWSDGKGRSTAVAEPTSRLDLRATGRTDGPECRSALSAESRPFAVLRL